MTVRTDVFNKQIVKWRKNTAGCEVLATLLKRGELNRNMLGKQFTRCTIGSPRKISKNAYEVALRRCVRKGWVKEAEKSGQQFLKLTKEGELRALLACLCKGRSRAKTHSTASRAAFWLAVFDIPEVARKTRDFLRWFLLMIGFRMLQKSVYISAFPISEEALQYLEHSGLRKYIRLMEVRTADSIEELRKMCAQ